MWARTIYITEFDRKRLEELVAVAMEYMTSSQDKQSLEILERALARAKVVEPTTVAPDVITMNSKVRLVDPDTEKRVTYELVFPCDADSSKNKISVLAPLGSAMLGEKVGNVVKYNAPAGPRQLVVDAILYQPEAAGDYDR